jgi:hypothetical protein
MVSHTIYVGWCSVSETFSWLYFYCMSTKEYFGGIQTAKLGLLKMINNAIHHFISLHYEMVRIPFSYFSDVMISNCIICLQF